MILWSVIPSDLGATHLANPRLFDAIVMRSVVLADLARLFALAEEEVSQAEDHSPEILFGDDAKAWLAENGPFYTKDIGAGTNKNGAECDAERICRILTRALRAVDALDAAGKEVA